VFDRWDRLGYGATTAYKEIVQWLKEQRSQQEMRLIPSPISLLDRAIQRFLWNGSNLPYDQLSALRELLETAQHYWEIDTRLKQISPNLPLDQGGFGGDLPHASIAEFIQLLRRGTITANPYPVRPVGPAANAVTLATIFSTVPVGDFTVGISGLMLAHRCGQKAVPLLCLAHHFFSNKGWENLGQQKMKRWTKNKDCKGFWQICFPVYPKEFICATAI